MSLSISHDSEFKPRLKDVQNGSEKDDDLSINENAKERKKDH